MIQHRDNTSYFVPIQNIGQGPALNILGVLFWVLEGEENGEKRRVTTTVCVAPHPMQLSAGDHGLLEFHALTPEPISAPHVLIRLWYESPSGAKYWTAERLSERGTGYVNRTGRGEMPTDLEERDALPAPYAEHLSRVQREVLAKRFSSGSPFQDDDDEPSSET